MIKFFAIYSRELVRLRAPLRRNQRKSSPMILNITATFLTEIISAITKNLNGVN